jgi:hypothetical protein
MPGKSRRRFLRLLSVGAIIPGAGCSVINSEPEDDSSNTNENSTTINSDDGEATTTQNSTSSSTSTNTRTSSVGDAHAVSLTLVNEGSARYEFEVEVIRSGNQTVDQRITLEPGEEKVLEELYNPPENGEYKYTTKIYQNGKLFSDHTFSLSSYHSVHAIEGLVEDEKIEWNVEIH